MCRTVLVTGASGGIGGAIAWEFARQGDRVVLGSYNHQAQARALCDELAAEGFEATALAADLRSEQQVEQLFCQTEELYGPVEVLVNNAGTAQQKMFCDITAAEWDDMFAIHVRGAFLCSQRSLPAMVKQRRGVILNMSSMWGQVGGSCEVHYSAAKAALIGMTKALAKELAPSGVRVNCIAPGAIDTPMLDELGDEAKQMLCEDIPLGRLGTAEEIAAAAVFLASDGAAYLTGQVLAPNGGLVV